MPYHCPKSTEATPEAGFRAECGGHQLIQGTGPNQFEPVIVSPWKLLRAQAPSEQGHDLRQLRQWLRMTPSTTGAALLKGAGSLLTVQASCHSPPFEAQGLCVREGKTTSSRKTNGSLSSSAEPGAPCRRQPTDGPPREKCSFVIGIQQLHWGLEGIHHLPRCPVLDGLFNVQLRNRDARGPLPLDQSAVNWRQHHGHTWRHDHKPSY